jgi:hypothetical protein
MPRIKEAKGFFHSFLIIGILIVTASLYSTVWAAAPSQGSTPPVAVPPGGALESFTTATSSTLTAPDGNVTVTIPSGAAKATGWLQYTPKTSADSPVAPPAGLAFASAIFELTGMDESGVAASSTSFLTPVTISVNYTTADVTAAQGNPHRLTLAKYDTVFEAWTLLTTSIDLTGKTAQTKVSSMSLFALLGQPQPPTPTPTPEATLQAGQVTPTATLLPPTPGDIAPGSGMLMGLLIAAFIMIAAGSYYLRQTRQS